MDISLGTEQKIINDTSKPGLLVLVIDTNPLHWFPQTTNGSSTKFFQQVIASALIFVNAYLLLHRSNQVVIIAAHAGKTNILYPDITRTDNSESLEQSSDVNSSVMKKLQSLSLPKLDARVDIDGSEKTETAIAASLARALCYINRATIDNDEISPRILVLQKSSDVSEQYISIMNCIFSAQKKSVVIDSCILCTSHSPFMQQAAYLTGGIYYKPQDQSGLLQYLLSIYLPDTSMRSLLKLPTQETVDFRAMCFCHQDVITTAFVCPVCLSLYCEFKPICPTCGIRSRIQPGKKQRL